jgi:membrane protease YdiL (CAAX protease family)
VLPTPEDAPPGAPEQPPRWGFGDVAITLVATLFLGTAIALVVDALVAGPWSSPTGRAWASLLLLVVPWVSLAGWPLLASRTRGNGPRRDFGLTLDWRQAGVGFAGGVVALFVGTWVAVAQEHLTGQKLSSAVGDLAQNTTSASAGALAILALCTAFGAPVVEEIAFRGLTFGAFQKMGQPVVWSVAWTTLIFGLFHFELARLGVLLVIGACLGAVRAYTGSTAASMVTHMTVNLPGAVAILTLGHSG